MSSPKPKRPGGKHHDSFIHKIHKRHDQRHHPGENRHRQEEQEPLLQEEHPDTASEVEAQSDETPTSRTARYREAIAELGKSAMNTANNVARRMFDATQNSSSVITDAIKTAGTTTKNSVSSAGKAVKNNPKRSLGTACGALALLSTGEAVDIFMHHVPPHNSTEVCLTPACVQAASGILTNLHPTFGLINPCDDFEQFVCGGFRLSHEFRADQGSIFTGSLVEDEIYVTIRHVLEQDIAQVDKRDKAIFKKVRDAYDACIDEEKIKEYGIMPLKGIIDDIRSHFASDQTALRRTSTYQILTSPTTTTSNSLTGPLIGMTKLGINSFLSLQIEADQRQPGTTALFVLPSKKIGLPTPEHYLDKNIVAEYTKAIEQPVSYFYGLPSNNSITLGRQGQRITTKDLVRGVVLFESRLAVINPIGVDRSKFKILSFDEFEKVVPQISMKAIVHELSPSYNATSVMTPPLGYLQALSKLIAVTPENVVRAYLIWKSVQTYANEVEHEMFHEWKALQQRLLGRDVHSKEDRWRTCVRSVNADFGWILSKFYVKKSLSEEIKDSVNEIIADIAKTLTRRVASSAWMTTEDQRKTLLKLGHMNRKVAYPTKHPNIQDSTALETFYQKVLIHNNTHLENKVQSARAATDRQWSQLTDLAAEREWPLSSTTVDAYYDVVSNEIVLPAAIMRQPLVYQAEVPKSLTYGAFGAITGHEIVHAFDNVGSHYDENGTLSNGWWSNATRTTFDDKSKCFADQYSQYVVNVPGGKIEIDGNMTLSESIADAGGLRSAYNAWMQHETLTPSKLLPGLTMFNQKQLFWLSYGNWWCSKTTEEALLQRILVSSGLPESIRVKGAVANSHEFREAFNCPVKKPTCELW